MLMGMLAAIMVFNHSNRNSKAEIGIRIVVYCCDRPDHVLGKIVTSRKAIKCLELNELLWELRKC